ncbi:(R)-stereoselective amidase [archaeon HR01]|nr:(R)-stereoselective amidase [archaeon HR01]
MPAIRVAAVQLMPSTVQESLDRAVEFIRLAHQDRASVVCLPEAWFHHNPLAEIKDMTASYGIIMRKLSDAARKYRMWIIAGGLYSPDGPSVVVPVISPGGDVTGLQEKVHLYRSEKTIFKHGKVFKVFDIDGVKAGILVCHDIVYPESARTLALKGAELIFNPSRIVTDGTIPWRRYLEVRCLENRLPIIAPNIILPNLYGGRSSILTVREIRGGVGIVETLSEGGDREEILLADIDLEEPSRMRSERLSSRVHEAYEI